MPPSDISAVKQLLDRNLKALNAQDIEGVVANQQPDAELVIPGGVVVRGHEQLRQYTEALWAAFPDGVFSFASQVLAEDAAAVELVFSGTHDGPLVIADGVVEPTGRRVTLRSASVMRFRDGLIAYEHAYPDQLEFMKQIGLLPADPDAAGPAGEGTNP
jgi:uncharacterized protein (TIGR02246 family)